MPTYSQDVRHMRLTTPLGADVLLPTRLTGREEISRLYSYQVDMISEKEDVDPKGIIGKAVVFSLTMPDDARRFFHGHVRRFSTLGSDDRLNHYRMEVVPWLWFLTQTSDCRIFQGLAVPAVIQKIFQDLGFANFELQVRGNHPARDYCVQYRETDFAFVSRLMEEEGIFYFFKHEEGKHTLVLADQKGAYFDAEEKDIECAETMSQVEATDRVWNWEHRYEFRTGRCAMTDYNFETPSTALMVNTKTTMKFDSVDKFEQYDYPGEYAVKGDGEAEVKVRMEEQEAAHDVTLASSNCRSFTPGAKFTVSKHHHGAEEGKAYVITAVEHKIVQSGSYISGAAHVESDYSNVFTCIPAPTVFRPERTTPRPFVRGVDTAVVVGPAGEEIYTDKYGRVKVQFFWDREGKKNENSSCWIRVSYPWAGKNWGTISIPRIGQEVIVDFLEGDPDRPLIVGRVYNAEQMPPWALPGGKRISGTKSHSSLGGGGFNELSFDDTKGSELINMHGQKDMTRTILNDSSESIGHDESVSIGNDRTESVTANETLSVGGDRTRSVSGSETVTVSKMRTHTVVINEAITIGVAQEVTVGAAQTITVGAAQATTVGLSQNNTVGVSQDNKIGAGQSNAIGSDQSTSVGGNQSSAVNGDHALNVNGGSSINSGKSISITAADEIMLKTGDAQIVLKKDGTIDIKGKDITITGSGQITAKADSDMVMKASKILQN